MRKIWAARPVAFLRISGVGAGMALTFALPSLGAEEPPAVRLLLPPLAPAPADGRYLADDQLRFMIDVENDQIRLRFLDSDAILLSDERAGAVRRPRAEIRPW